MNTRTRLAVLTPLLVSSLGLGAVGLAVSSAHAAVPDASCLVKTQHNGAKVTVNGSGFKPKTKVLVEGSTGKTFTANVTGSGSFGVANLPAGSYTATQSGTGEVSCGSAKESGQKDAQGQFRKGFKDGFADLRQDCKQKANPGLTAVDPNYEKGYTAGAAQAVKQFC
ncbi:hypothetical protein [Streptomyces sp. cmx-4-9]|uniref:hypothetical protein n=1 Tax=Streptomyces sp. cmx-4-9 TaxID=2790941 RepID=UPI00397F15F5